MNPIEQILTSFPIVILDGAMATELENYGCNLNDRLWSAKVLMENPELIKKVHLDYFQAGADCAITASYQATIEGYKEKGLTADEAADLIKKSVGLAQEARDEFWAELDDQSNRPKPLVAASVGPYGAFLSDGSEYRGDYGVGKEELKGFHRSRMELLVEAGADLLACETIPSLLEAEAIVEVLAEFPGVYAWISFSAKDAFHTSNGETAAECAKYLDGQEQVAAIGINCTAPAFVESLIREIAQETAKPIIVYPNSGEAYDPASKTWDGKALEQRYSSLSQRWHKAGATVIGGCCRTSPQDIEGIAAWVRNS